MRSIISCCIVLHNMCVENRIRGQILARESYFALTGTAYAIGLQVDECVKSQNHICGKIDIHEIPYGSALRRVLKGMRSIMDEIEYQNSKIYFIEHLWEKRGQSCVSEREND